MHGDRRVYVGAALAVAALVIMTALMAPMPTTIPSLSIRSSEADGSMALHLWLEATGYPVREVTSLDDQLQGLRLLFVLNPIVPYSDTDALLLGNWVRQGNILVIAGAPSTTNALYNAFAVQLTLIPADSISLSSAAPTFLAPPYDSARVEAVFGISTERADAVPHLFSHSAPVLVSLTEGRGTVWIVGAYRPFTNRGLHDTGNAALIANMLAGLPPASRIGFDEAAHGFGEERQQSLSEWLFGTVSGWGIVVGVVLTMGFLALRGQRFGRAEPLPEQGQRRELGEYIQAMAILFRRSGQRGEVVAHYEQQLRRRLSERYAIDPTLEWIEMVKAVAYHDPSVDEAALRALSIRLRQPNVNEHQLVEIALEVDRWLRSIT
jgi:uncharacterized protein DUF4350